MKPPKASLDLPTYPLMAVKIIDTWTRFELSFWWGVRNAASSVKNKERLSWKQRFLLLQNIIKAAQQDKIIILPQILPPPYACCCSTTAAPPAAPPPPPPTMSAQVATCRRRPALHLCRHHSPRPACRRRRFAAAAPTVFSCRARPGIYGGR